MRGNRIVGKWLVCRVPIRADVIDNGEDRMSAVWTVEGDVVPERIAGNSFAPLIDASEICYPCH
jgi:hypothetical protein